MENKIDWVIHYVANGAVCAKCGKVETGFIPNFCNAHTHGMEKYHHPDFQMVLDAGPSEECGRKVLRVIIPDKENRFPDERGCELPYLMQLMETDAYNLFKGHEHDPDGIDP